MTQQQSQNATGSIAEQFLADEGRNPFMGMYGPNFAEAIERQAKILDHYLTGFEQEYNTVILDQDRLDEIRMEIWSQVEMILEMAQRGKEMWETDIRPSMDRLRALLPKFDSLERLNTDLQQKNANLRKEIEQVRQEHKREQEKRMEAEKKLRELEAEPV